MIYFSEKTRLGPRQRFRVPLERGFLRDGHAGNFDEILKHAQTLLNVCGAANS
jgi:hypothetical protein